MLSEKLTSKGSLNAVIWYSDVPSSENVSFCELKLFFMVTHLSVVGSGPILIPGKSCSRRYLMKVVLPVEY